MRRNRPAIVDLLRIGELMRAIYGYRGDVATEFALKLLPLTFVRPGELRLGLWREFDLKGAEWRIPGKSHGKENLGKGRFGKETAGIGILRTAITSLSTPGPEVLSIYRV